jgi:hypothetical protein
MPSIRWFESNRECLLFFYFFPMGPEDDATPSQEQPSVPTTGESALTDSAETTTPETDPVPAEETPAETAE